MLGLLMQVCLHGHVWEKRVFLLGQTKEVKRGPLQPDSEVMLMSRVQNCLLLEQGGDWALMNMRK